MRKIVFLSSIMNDGIGDLIHLENLVSNTLNCSIFKEAQVAIIVRTHYQKSDPMFLYAEERLQKLAEDEDHGAKICYFYGDLEDHILFSQSLLAYSFFEMADQIIVVSYHDGLIERYESVIDKETPVKFIGEHERVFAKGIETVRSLGLGPSCYGIKIKEQEPLTKEAAFATIAHEAPDLYERLLNATLSSNWESFDASHNVIISYFKCLQGFMTFLILLSINNSLVSDKKHICLYLSGLSANNFVELECLKEQQLEKLFRHSPIKKIIIIEKERLFCKEWGTNLTPTPSDKTLTILIGHQISTKCFMALYDLAYFAGVSGDNSLEDCISKNLLMFYWSTNYESKAATLRALSSISKTIPQLNKTVKKYYEDFFSYPNLLDLYTLAGQWINQKNIASTIRELRFHPFKNLDFSMMRAGWSNIVATLRKKHNFYNYFEQILLEPVDKEVLLRRAKPILYTLVPAIVPESNNHQKEKIGCRL